jgi:type VI secretion system FHA domain protein
MSGHWAPPVATARAPSAAASVWAEAAAPVSPSSDWSSPVSASAADPSAADVWGKLAEGNTVDWSRGGFGQAPAAVSLSPAPAKDPFGLSSRPAEGGFGPATAAPAAPAAHDWDGAAARLASAPQWGPATAAPTPPPETRPATVPPVAPRPATAPAAGSAAEGGFGALLAGAGLSPSDIKADPQTALAAAGDVLRRLVAGMVVMMEARARAKAQLGAQSTSLEFDGNNPLKFARSPEGALAQLINPPERGFMPADRAVEDAFRDLQAHQMATILAMQGALAATLARFSPAAIRERAEMRGVLAKIIPAARDAELWKAYEREFEGVARGSDEAFMDVFAKEFKNAYERTAADMKAGR